MTLPMLPPSPAVQTLAEAAALAVRLDAALRLSADDLEQNLGAAGSQVAASLRSVDTAALLSLPEPIALELLLSLREAFQHFAAIVLRHGEVDPP